MMKILIDKSNQDYIENIIINENMELCNNYGMKIQGFY